MPFPASFLHTCRRCVPLPGPWFSRGRADRDLWVRPLWFPVGASRGAKAGRETDHSVPLDRQPPSGHTWTPSGQTWARDRGSSTAPGGQTQAALNVATPVFEVQGTFPARQGQARLTLALSGNRQLLSNGLHIYQLHARPCTEHLSCKGSYKPLHSV